VQKKAEYVSSSQNTNELNTTLGGEENAEMVLLRMVPLKLISVWVKYIDFRFAQRVGMCQKSVVE